MTYNDKIAFMTRYILVIKIFVDYLWINSFIKYTIYKLNLFFIYVLIIVTWIKNILENVCV